MVKLDRPPSILVYDATKVDKKPYLVASTRKVKKVLCSPLTEMYSSDERGENVSSENIFRKILRAVRFGKCRDVLVESF